MIPRFQRALPCALLVSTALAAFLPAASGNAQSATAPKKEYYIGEGEVDLYGGTFKYSNTDLSIGPAEGGMALVRYAQVRGGSSGSFGYDTGHNLEVAIYREPYREDSAGAAQSSYYFHVLTGRHVVTFDWNRYSTTNQSPLKLPDGSTLAYSSTSGPFVYTAKDGTVVNFPTIAANCRGAGFSNYCSYASSMVSPNGATTEFQYDLAGVVRLRLATNNHGFGIGFEYQGADATLISKACALDLVAQAATVASPCPAGTAATGYGYSYNNLITFTDAAANATTYGYSGNGLLTSIRGPGSATDDLVIGYHPTSNRVSSQTYANGATWSYVYQMTESPETAGGSWNEWTEVTTPLGHKTTHNFLGGQPPKPKTITDPLGRVTTFSFVVDKPGGLIEKKWEPEGNYAQYSYDSRENVTQTRLVAKGGSGLSDIVSTAVYPATCANQKTCDKPLSTTDARGGTTDYVYDQTHGGTLSVTGPAVNGVRPQVRYTYAQRYAGVKDGSGALVQSATPVWVLVEETQCMTTSACTGGADEVQTAYDWGTYASGPLMLRGKVVDPGGLNLRTCYGYDARGNRISETEPKAGLQSCP